MTASAAWQGSWKVTGHREACQTIVDEILAAMDEAQMESAVVFAVRLSVEEALSNAIAHGHGGDLSLQLCVDAEVRPEEVVVSVKDVGPGFDPASVPDPTAEENLTIASGRGLALIRAFMTEVDVPPPGNRIVMRWKGCGCDAR
ncbi:MAG: ATP-binding protein [Planctomycetes bacterium]|jgi:serine/threonine-protein kinase RsbW|nr:ATP-binding protein [Planctomycetota bacterium]MCP4837765.1 ATP-binding protein [Planctomycetota bacterium]